MKLSKGESSAKVQGKVYALIFAVEKYMEGKLDNVRYAERDATEVAKALSAIGYNDADIAVVLNDKATKTTIEYEVRQLAKTATKGDTVFFFFAGHGYTWEGRNYLLAYDTRVGDIVGTAVPLRHLFELFEGSECRQVMFFLDCCHSGLHLADEARGVLEEMSREELQEYFDAADFRVVFSSCDKGEYSYPSNQFKHGYWTFHLLKALRGDEPGILDHAGRIRSSVLQDYLRSEVPKQLALQSTDKRLQTPRMFGDVSGTFVIADLSALLAKAAAQAKTAALSLKHITLRRIATNSIKGLSGFRRGHKVPDYRSQRTEQWVSSLAEGDLRGEMEVFFDNVKNSGVYKSKEIQYDSPTDGGSSIRTPDFEFSISYSQNEEDPGEYEVRHELLRLNTPEILDAGWFNELFRRVFNEAVFEFSGEVDIEEFIDRAEEIEALSVDYDGDRSYCSIRFKGFEGEVRVTEDSLTYTFWRAETPKEMALQLQAAQGLLLSIPAMQKALPL